MPCYYQLGNIICARVVNCCLICIAPNIMICEVRKIASCIYLWVRHFSRIVFVSIFFFSPITIILIIHVVVRLSCENRFWCNILRFDEVPVHLSFEFGTKTHYFKIKILQYTRIVYVKWTVLYFWSRKIYKQDNRNLMKLVWNNKCFLFFKYLF